MLKIASNLELPDEAVTQTFAILAKRGSGKTYTGSVVTEEMLKAGMQVIVIDPVGVWWGLRASADGKKEGLPIVIAGGEHADLPITPKSGELLAEAVVEGRMSIVIDLSLFRKGEQVLFMTEFAETLYRKNRQAVHLMLDEADAFAPQRPMPGEQRMLGAIEDIVRRGRARGIGVTMITQRPSVLNKNVLTQIEVLVALRLTAPLDQKAIDEWVKTHAEEGQREEFMASLPSLDIGTAWFWSPGWLNGMFKKVQVRKRETLDSSSTPKAGEKSKTAAVMANVDLEALRERLAATTEQVESNNPKELKQRIKVLEQQLADQKQQVQVKIVKEPSITPQQMATLRRNIPPIMNLLQELYDIATKQPPIAVNVPEQPRIIYNNKGEIAGVVAPVTGGKPTISVGTSGNSLGLAERKILSTLAQYPQGRTLKQVAVITGYASKGGGFRNALSSLRVKGLMQGTDILQPTDAGLKAIRGHYEELPTGQELVNYWKGKLGKAERSILDVVVSAYPNELTLNEIASDAGYESSGGGFRNALSRLRVLELISGRDRIVANDNFFK